MDCKIVKTRHIASPQYHAFLKKWVECAIPSPGKGRKGFLPHAGEETPPCHVTSGRTPPKGGNFLGNAFPFSPLCITRKIKTRMVAGERLHIMDKMRLIVITAFVGNLC